MYSVLICNTCICTTCSQALFPGGGEKRLVHNCLHMLLVTDQKTHGFDGLLMQFTGVYDYDIGQQITSSACLGSRSL